MSDMDFDFGFGKEKDTPRIWETGTEKKENRRILDADRDVMLHGLSTDEDKKENEETKKALIIEESNVDMVENGSGTTCTGFSWNLIMIMYRILMKTAKYCKGTKRAKFLLVSVTIQMFGKVNAPDMKNERCIKITPYKFGTDLELECICRCNNNECTGTKQWTGGPDETTLTHNNHSMEDNIQIVGQNSFNYSILIKKATTDDLNSNYICNFGTLSKQISLDGYDQQSTPASPAVSTVTSTHGQVDRNNGGLIAGAIVGVVIVAGVVLALIIWRCKKRNRNRGRNEERCAKV